MHRPRNADGTRIGRTTSEQILATPTRSTLSLSRSTSFWRADRSTRWSITRDGRLNRPIKERLGCLNGDIEAWRQVFELNFFAPLRLSRGLAAALARGKGAVVNVTSIAGHSIHPFAGSAYSTSKAALSALTRELANEFAELDVRVNAVAPGEIETAMLSPETEVLIPRIPLHRLGQPKDVASTIYYLCSEDSAYVTGTEIFVTGGQHLL